MVAATAVVCAAQQATDYTSLGPFDTASLSADVTLTLPATDTEPPANVTVDAIVTYPTSCPAPFPVVAMFNGFQMRAAWYGATVRHVASWGYVVLQYTHRGALPLVVDRVELNYLDPMLRWLDALPTAATLMGGGGSVDGFRGSGYGSGPLGGPLPDPSRLAVMGHSRGAKLAALHLATRPDVSAAVLLDPIDGSGAAPEGRDYPSAARALEGAGARAALVGAGVTGRCNPADAGPAKFWPVLDPGSWRLEIHQAGHSQFARSGNWLVDAALDRLCGTGGMPAEAVMRHAGAVAVAWLEGAFRPRQAAAAQARYRQWLAREEEAGVVGFEVKPPPPPPPAQQQQQQPGAAAARLARQAAAAVLARRRL